jgi:hypothetical protein
VTANGIRGVCRTPDSPLRSVYRTLSLRHSGRQVLGADLDRSELVGRVSGLRREPSRAQSQMNAAIMLSRRAVKPVG